jgi:hypothetical protein
MICARFLPTDSTARGSCMNMIGTSLRNKENPNWPREFEVRSGLLTVAQCLGIETKGVKRSVSVL